MPVILRSKLRETVQALLTEAIAAAEAISDEGRRITPQTLTIRGTFVNELVDLNAIVRSSNSTPSGAAVTEVVEDGFSEETTREGTQTSSGSQTSSGEESGTNDTTSTDEGSQTEEGEQAEKSSGSSKQGENTGSDSSEETLQEESGSDTGQTEHSQVQGTSQETRVEYEPED